MKWLKGVLAALLLSCGGTTAAVMLIALAIEWDNIVAGKNWHGLIAILAFLISALCFVWFGWLLIREKRLPPQKRSPNVPEGYHISPSRLQEQKHTLKKPASPLKRRSQQDKKQENTKEIRRR